MVVSAACRVHVPLKLAAVVPWNGEDGMVESHHDHLRRDLKDNLNR